MYREVIRNLLHNLGGRAEVDRYLSEYTGPGRYSVVKVGGGLIADNLDELASALVFMHNVGLNPVVVHGAGPQLSSELASSEIETQFIDGLRVTTPQVLNTALKVFQRVGSELADAIDSRGVRARPLVSGIFEADPIERGELGRVGEVRAMHTDPIARACQQGQLPILSPIGTTRGGELLNINADTVSKELALELHASKVIYLTPSGGILDASGKLITAVNCSEDLEPMISSGVVSGGMARKLIEIDELLSKLDEHASVSITTPAKVARELFTHRGSGTLIRKGRPVRVFNGLDELERDRVVALLEQSFQRPLDPGYIDSLGDARIYLGGDYAAIAIIKQRGAGAYLDKLGLSERAQGIGLGASLWSRIRNDYPSLYWRSRSTNHANTWYLPRSDGMQRSGNWIVFWYGISDRDTIDTCISDAMSVRQSFGPLASSATLEPKPPYAKETAHEL